MQLKKLLLLLIISLCPLQATNRNDPLWVESEGMTFWTESLGEWSSDKAIILVAGLGANGRFWPDCFCEKFVEEGYFVIRYDYREVGLSSHSCPKKFEVEDLADDVVAILDAYQLPRAHVIGLSMGGMVAQFVAANYPHRVHTLGLIATSPVGATPRLDHPLTFSETMTLTSTLHFLSTHLLSDNYNVSMLCERYAYFNGSYPLDEEILKEYLWDMYYRTNYVIAEGESNIHLQNGQRMMSTLNRRRGIFKRIEAPTLIIHGAMDNLILISRGGLALHEAIQGAILKIYPKMGHGFFNRELLDTLAKDLHHFIQEHEAF